MGGLSEVRSDTTTSYPGLECPAAEEQTPKSLECPAAGLQKVSALCVGPFGDGGVPRSQLGIMLSACLATPALDARSSVCPLWRGATQEETPRAVPVRMGAQCLGPFIPFLSGTKIPVSKH